MKTAILLGLLMVTTAFIALPSASAKPLPVGDVDCYDPIGDGSGSVGCLVDTGSEYCYVSANDQPQVGLRCNGFVCIAIIIPGAGACVPR